jgi:PAS domain S-box-containing protein
MTSLHENSLGRAPGLAPADGTRIAAAIALSLFAVGITTLLAFGWNHLSAGSMLAATMLTVCVAAILHYAIVGPFIARTRRTHLALAQALRTKEAEAAELAATLARKDMQRLVLGQHSAVSETDADGRITYVNAEFIRLTGYTSEELVGQNHSILNSGTHPAEFWRDMYQTLERDGIWKGEVCNKAKDGSLYWIRATFAAVKDVAGKITGYVSVRSDITQTILREQSLKRAQMKLLRTTEKAKTASLAKSNFLSTMSHEMRTPLNGVIGALDLVSRTGLDKEQSELVDIALQSSEALLVHINDVLDFSKMEAGKLDLDSKPFDLNALVKSVLDIVATQADARGNRLESEFKGTLPRYLVGDRIRVRQVLLNLVSNANKFTKSGRITVRLERIGGSDERPEIEVGVLDSGIGIPENRLKDLFQEFSMLDSSYTRKTSGTGLGLAISKRLVEAMNGSIGVNSVEGEGSHFWFRLSLASLLDAPSQEIPVIRTAPVAARKLNILVVDDNATNRIVASRMLESEGHDVATANNGREALEAASATRYDAIFMDISMPEMDGIEATGRIRALPEPFRSVRIVALTANAIAGDRERFLAAGMDDYLTKPIRRADIEKHLSAILGAKDKGERAPVAALPPPADSGDKLAAVIDVAELEKLAAETSPDVVPIVVDEFLKELAARLEQALAAMSSRNFHDLKQVTHAIAGASASTGARRLREAAKEIEQDCIAGNCDQALRRASGLPDLIGMTEAAFEKHLAELTRSQTADHEISAA